MIPGAGGSASYWHRLVPELAERGHEAIAETGRDDRFFPAEFQKRVARQRLGITPDLIPGGHLPALSHPSELADLLESYRG